MRRIDLVADPLFKRHGEIDRLRMHFDGRYGTGMTANDHGRHDAILLEAPLERLEEDTARLQDIMVEAGRRVLGGFELRTDADYVRYPDRYADPRGVKMWDTVQRLLREHETDAA